MSRAYKCDRCQEVFAGTSYNIYSRRIAYWPEKNNYETLVKISVDEFYPRGTSGPEITPDLCKQCRDEIVRLALEKPDV
ncbi:hypothetical protein LCGC14_1579270 [marine sediment metagenome]|uniref:Uncharacterized protein n=1 Tax=marine sediment metagenome TaxID=412755 RepID=A0A0F9IHC4_9ZZZZ